MCMLWCVSNFFAHEIKLTLRNMNGHLHCCYQKSPYQLYPRILVFMFKNYIPHTHTHTHTHHTICILEKWFPLQGEQAHSLNLLSFQDQNREVGGQINNNRPINLLKVIIFSLQVHHLTLTFIIHNKYITYIHTYIHTYIIYELF